jgi:putative transcription factor
MSLAHQDREVIVWKKNKPDKVADHTHNVEGTSTFRNLDSDEPEAPKTIDHSVKVKIQQGRIAKKMTQKQLAMKINLPVNTVQSYEAGKAIPDKAVMRKICNTLGIKV